jgi:ABC-type branched-subunit amino acid transport system substrate-binding protein
MILAACGSQLEPTQVAGANGGQVTTNEAGEVVPGAPADGDVGGDLTAGGASSGTPASGTVPGTTPGSGSSGTTPGGGGGGTTSGGGGGAEGEGDNAATGGGEKAACDGFKNGPGVTDTEITIGNSSDVSGPVPGLFESSQTAVKAYVAYFNSTSDICGRKLKLATYDSRTDAGADQQAYTKGCDEVFAMVGSMSAFDGGGAGAAQGCGLPDIRSAAVTKDRNACTTCFPAQSVNTGEWENAPGEFIKRNYPDAAQHAAVLYINAGAAAENGPASARAMTKQGLKFDVVQGIDVAEFNYAPYAQQLKDKGIKAVFWTGAYQQSVRLAQAMQQIGYKPDIYLRDPTDYIPDFVSSGGDAVDGTVVFLNFVPFEEAGTNKEMELYLGWLQQVSPGADPTFFGVFSWSAARLFVEQATKLGGTLSRQTLVDSLKKVDNWTANGMTAPQHVGSKRTGDCWRFIQLSGGTWKAVDGTKYSCLGTNQG